MSDFFSYYSLTLKKFSSLIKEGFSYPIMWRRCQLLANQIRRDLVIQPIKICVALMRLYSRYSRCFFFVIFFPHTLFQAKLLFSKESSRFSITFRTEIFFITLRFTNFEFLWKYKIHPMKYASSRTCSAYIRANIRS